MEVADLHMSCGQGGIQGIYGEQHEEEEHSLHIKSIKKYLEGHICNAHALI